RRILNQERNAVRRALLRISSAQLERKGGGESARNRLLSVVPRRPRGVSRIWSKPQCDPGSRVVGVKTRVSRGRAVQCQATLVGAEIGIIVGRSGTALRPGGCAPCNNHQGCDCSHSDKSRDFCFHISP